MKQERVIEAIRQGLEGDAAVEFLCGSGFPMTSVSVVRNLRQMGGRQRILQLIEEGKSNTETLRVIFPEDLAEAIPSQPPEQCELFVESSRPMESASESFEDVPLYETAKLTLRIPSDLYEAIRIAARAEHKSQSQLIIEILSATLARMPELPPE
jgi:hypothetical protein